jgi:hypothetical protein
LQTLQLTTHDIVADVEHLLLEKNRQQPWNAPKAVITLPDGRIGGSADDTAFVFRSLARQGIWP